MFLVINRHLTVLLNALSNLVVQTDILSVWYLTEWFTMSSQHGLVVPSHGAVRKPRTICDLSAPQ